MNPTTYRGTVERGTARATKLGFPTINIALPGKEISGVYAAEVRVGEAIYPAVAFADRKRGILEAHLLDFSGDLYGEVVAIELHEKIRDPLRFATDAELSRAIAGDAQKAREYFAKHP